MHQPLSKQDEFDAMSDEAIREKLENLRAILNTASDAILTIDQDGIIIAANPATTRIFGYTENELVGERVELLMDEPYRSEHASYLKRYQETGIAHIIGTRRELTARRKDGKVFPIELSVSEFQDGKGPMYTGIIHDITRRRELERHLADARIKEQHRVAQELHDGLGGQLTGIALLIKSLGNKMQQEGSAYCEQVNEIIRHIDDAHQQLRCISRGLSPVEVLPDGLSQALRQLAKQTDQADAIRCTFESDDTKVNDPTVAAQLYRIAQEAVSNAIRHGQPRRIEISLVQDRDHYVLTIKNDGHTFEHLSASDRGMGIRTMKQRASQIDGNLWIAPCEGGGTIVTCRAPCPSK